MKKITLTGIVAIVAITFFATNCFAEWATSFSVDKMDGTKTYLAWSDTFSPTEAMKYPYHDVRVKVVVYCVNGSLYAVFHFNKKPNLRNTKIEDGFSRITARVKWDDKTDFVALTQAWGSNILEFFDDNYGIENIKKSSKALLELSWYGEGSVYFEIPLEGSAKAIQEIIAKSKL